MRGGRSKCRSENNLAPVVGAGILAARRRRGFSLQPPRACRQNPRKRFLTTLRHVKRSLHSHPLVSRHLLRNPFVARAPLSRVCYRNFRFGPPARTRYPLLLSYRKNLPAQQAVGQDYGFRGHSCAVRRAQWLPRLSHSVRKARVGNDRKRRGPVFTVETGGKQVRMAKAFFPPSNASLPEGRCNCSGVEADVSFWTTDAR
jgi:hypothetical protein